MVLKIGIALVVIVIGFIPALLLVSKVVFELLGWWIERTKRNERARS